jgi:hypothetical protein
MTMAAGAAPREGLRFPFAVGAAMVVVLVVAGACMAVSSNFFDGGTDEGNRIVAVCAGLATAALTLAVFVRGGMSWHRGVAAITVGWVLAAGLVMGLFLLFLWIGCGDDCS